MYSPHDECMFRFDFKDGLIVHVVHQYFESDGTWSDERRKSPAELQLKQDFCNMVDRYVAKENEDD